MRTFAILSLCASLSLSAACTADPSTSSETDYVGYTKTRYPIVLIPGLLGFKSLFGIEEYFHGIPEALTKDGAQVFVVTVNQAGRTDDRVQEILPQLDAIVAQTGAAKLNLIGHSAGSLDAREIAALRPDLIASVTSIGGPHKGSPVADALAPNLLGVVAVGAAADFIQLLSGSPYPNDAQGALDQMSTAGMAAFDAQYPAAVPAGCGDGAPVVNGIAYYSWGGGAPSTNIVDPSDILLVGTSLMVSGMNDGVIPRCSSHLGHVIRDDYTANHLDETNLIFGLVSLTGPDPISLYRQQANRLALAGL
jgi:triacylglycerol lipase